MIRRAAAAAIVLALALGMTTACQPDPAPSASGPIFANEEEAFAAAEETYRAYVDALNQRRADPGSSPDPQTFLTGQALEVDIETRQQLDQAGLSLEGSTEVTAVSLVEAQSEAGSVQLEVCLDSNGTRVINQAGDDVTPVDREAISLLTVDLLSATSGLMIENSTTKLAGKC